MGKVAIAWNSAAQPASNLAENRTLQAEVVMAKYARLALLSGLLVLFAFAEAEEKRDAGGLIYVECALRDGTRVNGRLDDSARITLDAGFGKVDVPLNRLTEIAVAEDRESLTLHFQNGDRLSGFAASDSFTVTSRKAKIEISFPKLRRCTLKTVRAIPADPLRIADVSSSGTWNGHGAQLTVDGNESTFWNAGDWRGWIECDLGGAEQIARIEFPLLFSPTGYAQYDIYASDKPMGAARDGATYVGRVEGTYQNGDTATFDCLKEVKARHVQVVCTKSASWFAIRELRILPPEGK
jgi:hypothetical protein